jgi:hypothetical protein
MPKHPDNPPAVSLREEFGMVRPQSGWWAWLPDPHFVTAVLAAVPVLFLLGMTPGSRMQPVDGWSAWLSFVALRPIAEELVFRGVIQGALLQRTPARRLGPVTQANLWTTAGFVALHFAAQPPAWALAVALPSLVFGHMRERFVSVIPAIALHAVYNAAFAVVALWVHP